MNNLSIYNELRKGTEEGKKISGGRLNGMTDHISTYSCGKQWFFIDNKSFYESIKKEEFEKALNEAKRILNLL